MDKSKARAFILKAMKYFVMNEHLYLKVPTGIFLKCVDEEGSQRIMAEMQKGACGGHHFWKATAYKILRVGYYWSTLYTYVFAKVRACKECQMFAGKEKLLPLPLKPIFVEAPFQ